MVRADRTTILLAAFVAATVAPAGAQREPTATDDIIRLPGVTVTAPGRLPSAPLPSSSVPASVQVIPAEEIRGSVTLQDALTRLPGISLSDELGNSFQPGLSLRGFPGSGVTGVPQGVSVFLDGVRLNEPAAEEINFDLIPLDDVERIEVYRGPGAVFGRNTLGGAVNLITKRGTPTLDAVAEAQGGSFGRQKYRLHVGGATRGIDYYVAGTYLHEDGWREKTEVRLGNVFGKLGHRDDTTDVTLSFQHTENKIEGPGSRPLSELRVDRRAAFTPDFFRPTASVAILNVRQTLGPSLALGANAFGRMLDAEQFNGNLLADDTRLFNHTTSFGSAAELTHESFPFDRRNRLTVGAEYTHHDVTVKVFHQRTARALAHCVEEAEEDGLDPAAACPVKRLDTKVIDDQHAVGGFVQDTLDVARDALVRGDAVVLTSSLRWDWLRHGIGDASPVPDRPRASGSGTFSAVNPRIGVNYNLTPDHGAYLVYAHGFRAPAFLELTCASPGAVCPGLQAGVAPDPPLNPVKVVSYELGLRSRPASWLDAEASLFRIDVTDDIFAVSPTGSVGIFFQNIGPTRREGFEAALKARYGDVVQGRVGYTFTRATFQEDIVLATPRMSAGCVEAPCTELVRAGNDLPLIPRHRLTASLEYRPVTWLSLSLDGLYTSAQRLRGDEANVEESLSGYFTLNAGARARWGRWGAFVALNNILNAQYETFGTFAPNPKLAGTPIERFLTPAPPINVTGGVSYRF